MLGDHIYVQKFGFTHHGIDCGDGTVIHYTKSRSRILDATIRRTSLQEFAQADDIQVFAHGTTLSSDSVVRRAKDRLGEKRYHFIFNNCEHFATWCKTGESRSHQTEPMERLIRGIQRFLKMVWHTTVPGIDYSSFKHSLEN